MMDGRDYWEGKKILITGITGFLGNALCRHFGELGAKVYGLSRVPKGIMHNRHTYRGDINDFDLIRYIISHHEIDTIFHCAANAIVRTSAKDPVSTYQVNVMGTVNLLEAARTVGCVNSIVVASSDKAYGSHHDLPYTEYHDLRPQNTYDTSKACMDMISRTYALNYDMPICVTRSSNIYGPGDPNRSRIIPNTITRIHNGLKPQLYSDVDAMEREFIFIKDVVDAYDLLARKCKSFKGEAFNIGGTGKIRISELVKKICYKMHYEEEHEVIPRDPRFKEIKEQYIDSKKLKLLTGWEPKFSLDEGLEHTIDYYRLWGRVI